MPPRFKADQTEQKLRGGYYTPKKYSDYIVQWIIEHNPKQILEPSCGDGVFLQSIIEQDRSQLSQIHCFEIDPIEAEKSAGILAAARPDLHKLECADFLGYALDHIQADRRKYAAIVGNPPYIRYQFVEPEFQELAQKLCQQLSLNFTKLSNAWVIFVLACIAMLDKGGRLGMVIPSEVLHVLYAQELRAFINQHCAKTMIINPAELWFKGTNQGTVMLLLEKKTSPEQLSRIKITNVANDDFLALHPDRLFPEDDFIVQPQNKWVEAILSKEEVELYHRALQHPDMYKLGDFAKASAAITTGANEFFVVPEKEAQEKGLVKYCAPAFSKSHHCLGIIYDQPQHELNQYRQERVNLVKFDPVSLDQAALDYIQAAEDKGLHLRYKCRVRSPWYVVPQVRPQVANINKFSHECPRLIVNEIGAYTTDGYYTVRLNQGIEASTLAVFFLNPITMISAELEGRFYGGGVLELMPTEISKLVVPYFQDGRINSVGEVNNLVKQLGLQKVVQQNGRLILELMGFSENQIDSIFQIWLKLKKNRTRK